MPWLQDNFSKRDESMTTSIGLDIGTSAVRAAKVRINHAGEPTLDQIGQVMLPSGAVSDGEVVDPDAVAECIRTLWSEWKLKHKKVAVGIGNQQCVTRIVDVPYTGDEELREALNLQAQDYVPIPLEQASLDFTVVEHLEDDEGGRLARVILVAAGRQSVDRIVEAVRQANLDPTVLDLNALAQLRSLSPDHPSSESGAHLLVDIGSAVTDIVVHQHGTPQFVRELMMGSGDITDALVASLGMTAQEAEQRKAECGCGEDAASSPAGPEVARIVGDRAGALVSEIRGSLDFYRTQVEAVPVTQVLITGGGSRMRGLREELHSALDVPIEAGRALSNVKIGNTGLDEAQLEEAEPFLCVAMGLALAPTS
jgi:type IV pilus assembly protein PilM